MIVRGLSSVIFSLALLVAGCGASDETPDAGVEDQLDASSPDARTGHSALLVDVVYDGDTLRIRAGSSAMTPDGKPYNGQHVRFRGVDAPEIAHPEATPPRPTADCWGNEAAAFARSLLEGKIVTLEYDPNQDLRDPYDRLLAYVKLQDGTVANEVLIRQGQAESYTHFPHRDSAKYERLEAQARAEHLGLWASCR